MFVDGIGHLYVEWALHNRLRRQFMHPLSSAIHGTYLRDDVHESIADSVACLLVPRAKACGIPPPPSSFLLGGFDCLFLYKTWLFILHKNSISTFYFTKKAVESIHRLHEVLKDRGHGKVRGEPSVVIRR
jgi:hypothetical protein